MADGTAAGWASLDEWGSELPGGRDAGVGGLWAGLEGLSGPEGGWSAGPRAHSPASRSFLSPDPEAPDASAHACAGGSSPSVVDPPGGRAVFAQDPLGHLGERMSDAGELLAAGRPRRGRARGDRRTGAPSPTWCRSAADSSGARGPRTG